MRILIAFALLCVSAFGQQEHWVATWGTSQQLYRAAAPPQTGPAPAPRPPDPARRFGIPAALAGVSNQTIHMTVRTSIGGSRARIRLESALGSGTVVFGAASIGDKAVTFSGKRGGTLYAGATLVSDPVDIKIAPVSHVDVSLFVPGEAKLPTSHTFALHTTRITREGDPEAMTRESYYWLAGLDVLAPKDAGTIVTFGDSITDGDQSTPDTDGPWPSILASRLQGNKATRDVAVVNAGISGNRILGDNGGGLARLYHDALSQPGVRWITLLEGINDITGGVSDADQLITAYRQVIEAAHLYGIKVIGCTLTPMGGSRVFTDEREKIRTGANDWIRNSGAFDGVIDFDKAVRDLSDPKRFRTEADSPDGLHPANPGYKLMGDAIDLKLFSH